MTRPAIRSIALGMLALPLALGLVACKKDAVAGANAPAGEKIAPIAAPAGKSWTETISTTPDGGYLMGNPAAPIKLVEYGSLSCPHCAKLAQDGETKLTNDYVGSGRVSFEFRSFAIHPQDFPLTALVRCADKNAFFTLIAQIYGNFEAMNAPLESKDVQDKANAALQGPPATRYSALADTLGYTQFFAQRGISVDQSHACLANPANLKTVSDYVEKYTAAGIDQTPTLMLNGTKLETSEWEGLEKALQAAGAR